MSKEKYLENRRNKFLQQCKDKDIFNKLEIIDINEYKTVDIPIHCCCKKHDIIYEITPRAIIRGTLCPLCRKEVLNKKHSLSTEEFKRRIKKIDSNLDFTGEYINRNENIIIHCNGCNTDFETKGAYVLQWSGCPICGNKIKFPNRLIRFFVKELNPDYYKPEYSPKWINRYFYDMYIEDFSLNQPIIIEMDGEFHEKVHSYDVRTLEEVKEIDRYKEEQAKLHNIKVIRINCIRKSHKEILDNLYNSELSELFDLTVLNLDKILKQAEENLLKKACSLYENGEKDLKNIAKVLNLSMNTIRNYLTNGASYGWCDYDHKKGVKKSIEVYNLKGKKLKSYDSIIECCNSSIEDFGVKFAVDKIICVAKGRKFQYKGYKFKYVNDN